MPSAFLETELARYNAGQVSPGDATKDWAHKVCNLISEYAGHPDEWSHCDIEVVGFASSVMDMMDRYKIMEDALYSISRNSCCESCQEAKLVAIHALSRVEK